MTTFGQRLRQSMAARGPVCAGIDPHAGLLRQWGLEDSPAGVREFSLRTIDALYDRAAAFKPQSAFYERHGAAGVAALEETLRACRDAEVPVIADVKRGDIGSTMDGYADAYLSGPLKADAFTVSPYLGPGSLEATARRAAELDGGLFVLALTSNPEGAQLAASRPRAPEPAPRSSTRARPPLRAGWSRRSPRGTRTSPRAPSASSSAQPSGMTPAGSVSIFRRFQAFSSPPE